MRTIKEISQDILQLINEAKGREYGELLDLQIALYDSNYVVIGWMREGDEDE